MKNIIVTVIVGFITGLVISGILFDVIKYVGKSFNRVSVSWNISKAEKAYSDGRFSDSVLIYKKTLPKIDTNNKILFAKTKNNLALSILKEIESKNNIEILADNNNSQSIDMQSIPEIKEALDLLNQAKDLYVEISNTELANQTSNNIKIIETRLEELSK